MPTVASGTTLSVSQALPATVNQAGFAALAYTQIRGMRSIPDIGEQYQTQPDNTIGRVRPVNRKVGLAALSLPLELIRIADVGQMVLRAALTMSVSYSYRLTQVDGLVMYFTAGATSRMLGGFSSGIADTKIMLEIDSAIIEV